LTILVASLPALGAPIQTPDAWHDGFGDDTGLDEMVDVAVDGDTGYLELAPSSVNPGQYVTSGLAKSILINPLVASVPAQWRFVRVTSGPGDYVYLLGGYEVAGWEKPALVAYQLSSQEFHLLHVFGEDASESEMGLTTGADGRIYIGLRDHLHRYTPGGSVQDLGVPIPGAYISNLAPAPSGRIYGIAGMRLFSYEPASASFADHGLFGTYVSWRTGLTVADDGRVYGGYDSDSEGRLFVYDPGTGLLVDKGQVLGQQSVNALAAGPDGRIYGGTNTYDGSLGRFFAYDPATDHIVDLTGPYGGVYALLRGEDDLIYGAARRNGWEAYLFVYDPASGVLKETGQIKAGDGHVSSLAWATDGRVYGTQTQGVWHTFYGDPIFNLVVYSPAITGFAAWNQILFSHSAPSGTSVRVDVLDAQGNLLLIDAQSGDSLGSIDPASHPALQLQVHLSGNGTSTPQLDEWRIEMSTAWIPYTVSGQVLDPYRVPMSGVLVDAGQGYSAITGVDGTFSLSDMPGGAYQLTPSKTGYAFVPPTRTVYVPPDATGQTFIVLPGPVSTTVTPDAPGSLAYVDTLGMLTELAIPTGAVTQDTSLVMTPTLSSGSGGFAFARHGFEIEAYQGGIQVPGLAFETPMTVTIHYSDDDLNGIVAEDELILEWWSGSAWQDAAGTCDPASVYIRDLANNVLSVPICHLSLFGLFGPAYQVHLPFVVRTP